jgi:hypothetical protein
VSGYLRKQEHAPRATAFLLASGLARLGRKAEDLQERMHLQEEAEQGKGTPVLYFQQQQVA